jgi:CO/xanthine dehydrogenase Mo-binding subunit
MRAHGRRPSPAGSPHGPAFADRPILATAETKFFGEPVAVVVAETRDAAAAAAALVDVEFDGLPAVLSVEEALDPAALVQDPSLGPGDAAARTNVLRQWTFGWGEQPVSLTWCSTGSTASRW